LKDNPKKINDIDNIVEFYKEYLKNDFKFIEEENKAKKKFNNISKDNIKKINNVNKKFNNMDKNEIVNNNVKEINDINNLTNFYNELFEGDSEEKEKDDSKEIIKNSNSYSLKNTFIFLGQNPFSLERFYKDILVKNYND
jgi:hypothetical protein